MIKMTYLKELKDKADTAIISFEGDVLDIYELRDYAKMINSVKGKNKSDCKDNYGKADYEVIVNPIVEIDMEDLLNALTISGDVVNVKPNVGDGDVEDHENDCDIVEEDLVNHPTHYADGNSMECIDEMVMLYGFEATMSFCKLNSHKYRKRALKKGGQMDLDKSNWYMNTYKELALALEIGYTPLQYLCKKEAERMCEYQESIS